MYFNTTISTDVKTMIYECISNVTGHKIEDLDCEMYLESDLGIDSIKMVTLMNLLTQLIPSDKVEDFTNKHPVTYLMSLQTIGEIVSIFEEFLNMKNSDETIFSETHNDLREIELSILNAQYPFLVSYWSVGTLTICSGVRLEGALKIKLLQESWMDLINRHPSLRAVFDVHEGSKSFKDYKLKIVNNLQLPDIEVKDLKDLPQDMKDQSVKQIIEEQINNAFDIFKWPLHKLMVIQINDTEFELILANNHLVSDGLGNQQILRELLTIYSSKIENSIPNLPESLSAEEYNKMVSLLNTWQDSEENKNLDNYIQVYGKKKYTFNPFNDNKISNEFAVVKAKKCWINEDITRLLLEKSKVWRVSLFTLIVSAYLKSVVKFDKTSSPILSLPTSGKVYPNADATGIIGCFAQNLALSFECSESDESWSSFVMKVDKEIRTNLSSGLDRTQIYMTAKIAREQDMLDNGRMTKTTASLVRSSLKSNLYLSFVGNTDIKERYGQLRVVDYEAYTSTNAGTIDNLIELFQNKIIFTSNYDSLYFDEKDINLLIEDFIDNIYSIANYIPEVSAPKLDTVILNDKTILQELRKAAEEVCYTVIEAEDVDKDLEAHFGVDSLQRIRLITRLSKIYGKIDRNALLGSRTLMEMAALIETNKAVQLGELEEIPYMKIVRQCQLTPDATAILFENKAVTYKELDENSNKIANYLIHQGIKRGSLVGIMVFPGPMMLIGMLGIMKAGAAYVPIDPSYPADRIQYIVNNSDIEILLSEQALKDSLKKLVMDSSSIKTLMYLDDQSIENTICNCNEVTKDQWNTFPESYPEFSNSPDDLMTVLYTSGSTGNPKGVMLAHRGYMNRLVWHQDTFKLKPGERVAQKTSCCFDISIWELFWPLMYGGIVCPVRKETVVNPWNLAQWMIENKINIMHFVPSLFGEFVNALEDDPYSFNDLRWLIFSGEALSMAIIQKWIDKHGLAIGLANLYGPTEASIDVTCYIIDKRPGANGENSIPIGEPIDNVFIKNLDKNMRELPDGEIGELWIGGIQVAKGYMNNKEKTEEAFKPNPFKEIPGEFLYRTGDLTTRRPDGNYEYHGRIDNQVKIRGFRVELGEIEAVLSSYPSIREAAVIAVDYIDGQKQLYAFVSGNKVTDSELKSFISKKLTYYMVPHHIVWLSTLPKNPNGKLDRKALRPLCPDSFKDNISENKLIEFRNTDDIPLSPAQSWIMKYFDAPYLWTGYTRFIYKQPLDFNLFNKALTVLTQRHDALRSKLINKSGTWVQDFLPEVQAVQADFYDGSYINNEQRDDGIKKLIDKVILDLKVDVWPLWKVVVIKINDSLYDISVIGHHLISDVITNNILFKEIWQIYGLLLSGKTVNELPAAKAYKDFVLQVTKEKYDKCSQYVDYWKKQFPSETYSFNIPLDFNKGENSEGSASTEIFALEKSSTEKLLTKAKKLFGTNVYPILLAPLYKLLQKLYNKSWIVVSHRVHGRDLGDGSTFFETVGNFAVNFPLGITLGHNDDWTNVVCKIKDELHNVPMHGVTYDLVSDELPSYMYPDIKLTPIRANYLGNRDLPELDVFEFSKGTLDRRYSPSEQKRISAIEFFFSIVNGQLNLEIEYSKNMFNVTTIKQLGREYLEAVNDMLTYINKLENQQNHIALKPIILTETPKKAGILSNRVALITGGGRGIGRSIAMEMAKEGADIVIVSRTKDELEQTAAELKKLGTRVLAIMEDIRDYEAMEVAINSIISEFGKIDILVNNAAITKIAPFTDISKQEWKEIIEVNLLGSYNLCRLVTPHFINQKCGKIINMGSDSSFIGYPMMSAYSVSKHGILGLTKSLAEELKPYNIQVNSICPAFVDSNMAPNAFRKNAIPPEKISDLAIFLASNKSNYITGEAIKIYGKQDMHWFGSQQIPAVKALLSNK